MIYPITPTVIDWNAKSTLLNPIKITIKKSTFRNVKTVVGATGHYLRMGTLRAPPAHEDNSDLGTHREATLSQPIPAPDGVFLGEFYGGFLRHGG